MVTATPAGTPAPGMAVVATPPDDDIAILKAELAALEARGTAGFDKQIELKKWGLNRIFLALIIGLIILTISGMWFGSHVHNEKMECYKFKEKNPNSPCPDFNSLPASGSKGRTETEVRTVRLTPPHSEVPLQEWDRLRDNPTARLRLETGNGKAGFCAPKGIAAEEGNTLFVENECSGGELAVGILANGYVILKGASS